jgi:hypothetical protein
MCVVTPQANSSNVRKEAARALSNVLAGSARQIAAVISCDLIHPIISTLCTNSPRNRDVRIEAAWCISSDPLSCL